MVRRLRSVVILQVASVTGSRSSVVIPTDVAIHARETLVRAGQRELRVLTMIEVGAGPVRSGVTNTAIDRKSGLGVARIRRRLK